MNLFELTRTLIDIDSVTPNEEQVGLFLFDHLVKLTAQTGGRVERMEVEPHRFNVLATWGDPVVTLSTHMDTVPPFFASREDDENESERIDDTCCRVRISLGHERLRE